MRNDRIYHEENKILKQVWGDRRSSFNIFFFFFFFIFRPSSFLLCVSV